MKPEDGERSPIQGGAPGDLLAWIAWLLKLATFLKDNPPPV